MSSRQVVSFHAELLPAAVALAAGGVRRIAARIDGGGSLLRLPALPAEQLVEVALRRYLAAEPDGRRAWAVLDGDALVAFAGTLAEELTPEDARYTYLPPRTASRRRPRPTTSWSPSTSPAGSWGRSWAASRNGETTRSSATCCHRGTATWG